MPPALLQALFPPEPRGFRGERWVNIVLRSLHLVGVAGVGGGFLFDLDQRDWEAYWHLALATGIALSALYLWTTAAWVLELKGLAVVVKTALLGIASVTPEIRAEVFVLVILISAAVAHAPGRVRGYRWWRIPGPPGNRR